MTRDRAATLLAYFSRAGENYQYGGRRTLAEGHTETVARMIQQRIGCDTFQIEAADPYPDDYDETVARNVREEDANARPAIATALPLVDRYDTLLVGCPIWNVRPPMIMLTFLESLDLAGKTILPFTTYAMSGLGTVSNAYASAAPGASIGEGLAIRGEESESAAAQVDAWLRRVGLLEG